MWRVSGVLVLAGAACGGAQSVEAGPETVVEDGARLASASATGNASAVRGLLAESLTDGGLWFADPVCASQFGAGGAVTAAGIDAFAACVAQLGLRVSHRRDVLPDVAVLEYAPGFEIEARFVDHQVAWIGFASRLEGDALPSVAAATLETLRVAGDRDGPIDPASLDSALKPHAWLHVCVDANGAVSDVQVRETTSTPGTQAFTAAARTWRFRPFMLGGQSAPVCGMFAMQFPPVHASDEVEKLPLPITLRKGEILVPQSEAKRIAGDPLISPDDETRVLIEQAGLSGLVGEFKLCLDTAGKPTSVSVLRSTRSLKYDQKIVRRMKTWTYAPMMLDGQPQAVCTSITLRYSQR